MPNSTDRACVSAPMAQYSEAGDSWSVAAGGCQSFSFESKDGSTLAGSGGTAVSQSGENQVDLKRGKLIAMAGSSGLSVRTGSGTVNLPSDSSAIIEEERPGIVRIEYLDGTPATVLIRGKGGETHKITAEQGQEVLVAGADATDEELIPVDGIERIAIEAKIQVANLSVHKNRFDRKELAAKDPLINCANGCVPTYIKNRIKKLKASIEQPRNTATAPNRIAQHSTPFRPVAQVIAPVTARPTLNSLDTANASVRYNKTTSLHFKDDSTLQLAQGEMVIAADKTTTIIADNGRVEMAPGSVAIIKRKGDSTSVSTVWANKLDSVKFISDKRTMSVAVGNELMLCPSSTNLDKVMRSDVTGRRRVHMTELPNGANIMTSEVSFISVLNGSTVLQQVFKSQNDTDKELSKKLSKMAVSLSVVTGHHGPYSRVAPGR
jgi:hypothetical protein